MKLSTKSRYAITAVIDLANNTDSSVALKDISDRQSISLSYLEQLFVNLKTMALLKATWSGGGYMLNKKANDIYYEIIGS